MSEILIHETRGNVVEAIYRGDAVVVGPGNTLVAACGDTQKYTYLRSAAKPIQAMQVILSGAAERYHFTDQELAIMCSSHYAEDFHMECVNSILKKIGLDESSFLCGAAMSLKPEVAEKHTRLGYHAERKFSDCTGKHSGMLAICLHKGYPIENYIDPSHPLQQDILRLVAAVCDYPPEKIEIGIDGCSVPVFGMPIYNMAIGFMNLANPANLPVEYREAANRIFGAMTAYPEMVAGTGGFCTSLMSATKGRMIGKIGAKGIYCIGIREPQLGIALKIEDGNLNMTSLAAMQILQELKLLTLEEYRDLSPFHYLKNLNDDKLVVGDIRPLFHLQEVF